jgi:cytochrome c oxidase assembly protein subunit 15
MVVAATAATFLLIAIGGFVRASGSGLGCSGWPKCSPDRWLPPLEYHALVEYSHRMAAFLDIVLVASLAVVVWRRYRSDSRLFRSAVAAVGLIVVQAVLGGIVVKGDLAALLVTAHFATAMILAADLVYAAVAAFTIGRHPTGRPGALTALAGVAAGAAFALLSVGAYVRGESAGLAFADWPLMNGRVVPPLAHLPQALMFVHRLLAVGMGILVGALALKAWRQRARMGPVAWLALVAAGLFVAQVLIGAALVWSRLSAPARVAHVAVSSLIWGALVAAASTARALEPRAAIVPVRASVRPHLVDLPSRGSA